jgi:hypothetical protein
MKSSSESVVRQLSWLAVAACSLPLFACSANVQPESKVSVQGSELIDQSGAGSAPDGRGPAHIGDSCNTDADCAGVAESHHVFTGCTNLFPGGYCTQVCENNLPNGGCPQGTFCLGGSFCVVSCVNDGCADPGQVCDVLADTGIPDKFCRTSCEAGTCNDGLTCVDQGTFCQ